jgi:PAS domain S-box-containing protein
MSITLQQAHVIFDHLNEMVWLGTGDWRLLYVNPAFEKIWGLDRSVLYSDSRGFAEVIMDTVVPEDRPLTREEMSRSIVAERDFNYRIVRADGAIRWIRSRRRPIHDEAGRTVQIVGLAEDVTLLREAELKQSCLLEQLQKSTATLNRLREDMVTMCAWTKRIHHAGRWISLEEFLQEFLDIPVTHGMSPDATELLKRQARFPAPGNPNAT